MLCPVIASDERGRVRALLMEHFRQSRSAWGRQCPEAGKGTGRNCKQRDGSSAGRGGKSMYTQRVGKREYKEEKSLYLNSLMESDTRKAVALVGNFLQSDIPSGYLCGYSWKNHGEVGELWHSHKISVDMEHYCTATTQTAMSQMYPAIFQSRRKGKEDGGGLRRRRTA